MLKFDSLDRPPTAVCDQIRQLKMTEIIRSIRDLQPAHFLLTIGSFSVISSEPDFEKYETDIFKAGDYKWMLRIYPNGDQKENAKDHISVYLVITDTKSLPSGWEVNVQFQIFVYNHIMDKYLTIQDEKTRRFHAMKTEWGFTQLMSLDVFKKPSSGYLVDDSCAIGAEVFVINYSGSRQCLNLMKNPENNSCTWTINNFSLKKDECLYSLDFMVGEAKWRLRLYPNGYTAQAKGKMLSLYLEVANHAKLPLKWKIYAKYRLRIRNLDCKLLYEKEDSCWFNASVTFAGFHEFLRLSDLNDKSNGYLENDSIIVEGEIVVVSV